MSRTITYYCTCSTCTQIRNEQPRHYRYINQIRYLLTFSCCSSRQNMIINNNQQQQQEQFNNSRISKIKFRDIDITNKHCSKHDVLLKASRPNFSKTKTEELRRRVKDANQRWTRMSILPLNLIDFIFKNKDYIPLCTICYKNFSPFTFNLCYNCIITLSNYQKQIDYNEENFFIDYIQQDSISF